MRYLNAQSRSIAAPAPADVAQHAPKFVIVEVDNVTNPRGAPLTFTVSFRPRDGADVALGSFSLYPADRPGRFIVAAQGKLQPGGQVVVTLQDVQPEGLAGVRVGVGAVAFGER